MGLANLPYDLLLNIALYLDVRDVHTLLLTCRTLHDFTTTRPVYRKLAEDLLRKCRALPSKGFQKLTDLSTEELIKCVNQASRYDFAWRKRAPKPVTKEMTGTFGTSHYLDNPFTTNDDNEEEIEKKRTWYKVISAPPNEQIDWLSPITSSYTLCATKSGKVVCWDVQTDSCLAEWNPARSCEKWELWKCRVEFEERTVFFTMAQVLDASQDDGRKMHFILMRLTFPPDVPKSKSKLIPNKPDPPIFSHVTEFKTVGVVMNIFLLDPSQRLLSAFIWMSSSNTIGLYALLDWDQPQYVFIDTGIDYVMQANWSCILYNEHIVIHCEKPEEAYQYFYPFDLLRYHSTTLRNNDKRSLPALKGRIKPARVLTKKFIFPKLGVGYHDADEELEQQEEEEEEEEESMEFREEEEEEDIGIVPIVVNGSTNTNTSHITMNSSATLSTTSNPFITLPHLPSTAYAHSIPSSNNTHPHTSTSTSDPHHIHTHIHIPNPNTHPHHHPNSTNNTNNTNSRPPNPNPFPFPQWIPESAHFVRQWWPSLPHIPKVSCTVVLLAMHDHITHSDKFVLVQHYFKVPIDWRMWIRGEVEVEEGGFGSGDTDTDNVKGEGSEGEGKGVDGVIGYNDGIGGRGRGKGRRGGKWFEEREDDDELMKMWYVSKPFDIVRVYDGDRGWDDLDEINNINTNITNTNGTTTFPPTDNTNANIINNGNTHTNGNGNANANANADIEVLERPRPLVAVDFGHAVWIEYVDPEDPEEVLRKKEKEEAQPNKLREQVALKIATADDEINSPLPPLKTHGNTLSFTSKFRRLGKGEQEAEEGREVEREGEEEDEEYMALMLEALGRVRDRLGVAFAAFDEVVAESNDARYREGSGGSGIANGSGNANANTNANGSGIGEREGEEDLDGRKVLRFVTFPGYADGDVWEDDHDGIEEDSGAAENDDMEWEGVEHVQNAKDKGKGKEGVDPIHSNTNSKSKRSINKTTQQKQQQKKRKKQRKSEGIVQTLEIPDELDLSLVETINIDQSQGAVILSDRNGKIWILCYE